MKTKSITKNLLKCTLAFGALFPILNNESVEASITACAESGTVSTMNSEANPCFLTPEKLVVTFYEVGFCTSDPLFSGVFDNSTCSTSWENLGGATVDIGLKTFKQMEGTTFRIPNATYPYTYAIMNNGWTYKAKYKVNGGLDGNPATPENDTFYTASDGSVTTDSSNYSDWVDNISAMTGEENTDLCYDYQASTAFGTVKAILANSSNVRANNQSECDNSTKVIGSIGLNTPIIMDDSVKSYRLTWQITNMGVGTSHFGGMPSGWRGGPFAPKFEFVK